MNAIANLWFSLILLSLVSSLLGWTLASEDISLPAWLAVVAGILLLSELLTIPLSLIKRAIVKWFQSDLGTFVYVIIAAFLFAVFLHSVQIFAKALMLICAEILARVDLLEVGLNQWMAFSILASISLICLGLGAGIYIFLTVS